jgi:hypothetical protein
MEGTTWVIQALMGEYYENGFLRDRVERIFVTRGKVRSINKLL